MSLVADAGPILSFARAQQLDLLRIVLAKEQDAALLIDEREARRVALRLGIVCIGSLRILTEAKERGIISRVKPILDALIAAGTYVGEPLYQSILHRVEEE